MAYMTSTLTSRPSSSSALGGAWDSFKSGLKSAGKGAIDFYGQTQGNKALADKANREGIIAAAAAGKKESDIKPEYLLIGGVALAGVLVFALRKK